MGNARLNRVAGRGATTVADWRPTSRVSPELILARKALDQGRCAEAERHLRRALEADPGRAETRTLMGLLHEALGEHHAAFQCYRLALRLDHCDIVASDGLRRYCERFGYDLANPAINPCVDKLA